MKQRAAFGKAAIALILLGSMAWSGCSPAQMKPDTVTDIGTAAPGETSQPAETETGRSTYRDNLPDSLDFSGAEVRVMYRGGSLEDNNTYQRLDVIGTDNWGDLVSDAVWDRNRAVEQRLNMTFGWIPSGAGAVACRDAIQKSVLAQSDDYDFINTSGNTVISSGLDGYMRDVGDMPYVDFSQPWWWRYAIDALSMDGKTIHYLFGDSQLVCFIQTGVVFYNKALYQNLFGQSDALYDVVLDGKWTLDRMAEASEAAYSDLNGDGSRDSGDLFGTILTTNLKGEAIQYLQGFDIRTFTRDEDGILTIDFDRERAAAAVEKLYRFLNENTGCFQTTADMNGLDSEFVKGRSLFLPGRFMHAYQGDLREMTDDYGILPFPKLEEGQKEYVTLSHNSGTVICVPATTSDARMEYVGAVLEATMAESYRSVVPKFIEVSLKHKYSRDEASSRTVDLIIATISKNTLDEYAVYVNDIYNNVLVKAAIQSGSFASSYEKIRDAAQNSWDKAVSDMMKTGGQG